VLQHDRGTKRAWAARDHVRVRRHLEHVPKFVQGHSMGGLIAVLAAHPREMAKNGVSFKGIVITGETIIIMTSTLNELHRHLAEDKSGSYFAFADKSEI